MSKSLLVIDKVKTLKMEEHLKNVLSMNYLQGDLVDNMVIDPKTMSFKDGISDDLKWDIYKNILKLLGIKTGELYRVKKTGRVKVKREKKTYNVKEMIKDVRKKSTMGKIYEYLDSMNVIVIGAHEQYVNGGSLYGIFSGIERNPLTKDFGSNLLFNNELQYELVEVLDDGSAEFEDGIKPDWVEIRKHNRIFKEKCYVKDKLTGEYYVPVCKDHLIGMTNGARLLIKHANIIINNYDMLLNARRFVNLKLTVPKRFNSLTGRKFTFDFDNVEDSFEWSKKYIEFGLIYVRNKETGKYTRIDVLNKKWFRENIDLIKLFHENNNSGEYKKEIKPGTYTRL